MAKRGPTPQSAAAKKQKGTSRRPIGTDPTPAEQKAVGALNFNAPAWLKKGGGLEVWQRLAPQLYKMRLLTGTDAESFARYCRNFQRWLDVNIYLDAHDAHYETDTGYDRMRAAMAISLRLEPVLERAEDRFGLNPAERQRIFAARAAAGPGVDLFSGNAPANADEKAPANAAEKAPAKGGEAVTGKRSVVGFLQ